MSFVYDHEGLSFSVRNKSTELQLSELDIFSECGYENSIERVRWDKIFCNEGSLERETDEVVFQVKPHKDMIDLHDSFIGLTLRLRKETEDDGITVPAATEKVVPVNMLITALFSDLNIEINSKAVHNTHGLFWLQSYLQLLLHSSSDSLPKWESAAGYYDDTKLTLTDPTHADVCANTKRRFDRFKGGKSVTLQAPIFSSGITNCARLFPSLTEMKFAFKKLTKLAYHVTKPSTVSGTFFMEIQEACLYIKRVTPYMEILNSIEDRLNNGVRALYYFENWITRSWPIDKQLSSVRIENVLRTSFLPQTIIAGFMDESEILGSYEASNYKFNDHGISELYLTEGGNTYPSTPFTPDFTAAAPQYGREFCSIHSADGMPGIGIRSDWGLARFNLASYKQHHCLYRISLTRSITESSEYEGQTLLEPRRVAAQMNAHIKFRVKPTGRLHIVLAMIYNDHIQIANVT